MKSFYEEKTIPVDAQSKDDFSNLVNLIRNNRIYMTLIIIDFTTLNKEGDYSYGDIVKKELMNYLKSQLKFSYKHELGGKIILFTQNPISSHQRQKIVEISQSIYRKKNESISYKFVYIIDKDNDDKLFSIGPFNDDLEKILNEALIEEDYLERLRPTMQLELQKADINIENVKEIERKIDLILNSKKKKILDLNNRDEALKKAFKIARNSKYLTNALTFYAQKKNNFKILAYNEVIKYFIWIKLQALFLKAFKTEKIMQYIHPKKQDEMSNIKPGIEGKVELNKWFSSVILPIYPYLDEKQKSTAKNIKNYIDNGNFSNQNFVNSFVKIVHDFVNNINIKGVFNVPTSNLSISNGATNFIKRQFYLNYKNEFENKVNEFTKLNFIRANYPIVIRDIENFPYMIDFVNARLFDDFKKENIYSHIAFIELDGFNAFNSYVFANDSDKVFNMIINSIFEVANELILKREYSQILRTMTVCIKGDEFYLVFLSEKKLGYFNQRAILNYLDQVRAKILKIAGNHTFVKTDKVDIITEKGKVVFRSVISKKNIFQDYKVELASLGVSGVVKFNLVSPKMVYSKENLLRIIADLQLRTERKIITDENQSYEHLLEIIREFDKNSQIKLLHLNRYNYDNLLKSIKEVDDHMTNVIKKDEKYKGKINRV